MLLRGTCTKAFCFLFLRGWVGSFLRLTIHLPCNSTTLLVNVYPKEIKIYVHAYNQTCMVTSISSVQFGRSVVSNSLRPHGLQHPRLPWSLLKLMSIASVISSNHLILCCPLLLLPSIFPSIRVFSKESVFCIRWSKSPSNEYSGLISFRIDWLDLLAVQGTLKSLLQHHSSKASVLQYSAFFTVQLSHPYATIGKTTALTRWTFVGKVMSLLFNMLSRLVITFLPRSKCLLISWLQSPSAVILEPLKNKVSHCFHCFPIYLPWSDGTRCHDLSFLNVEFKPTFSLSSFTFIKRLFSSSLSVIKVMSSVYLRLLIFLLAIKYQKSQKRPSAGE